MTLHETIQQALNSNDVECQPQLIAIRQKARLRGIDNIDEIIRQNVAQWREGKGA